MSNIAATDYKSNPIRSDRMIVPEIISGISHLSTYTEYNSIYIGYAPTGTPTARVTVHDIDIRLNAGGKEILDTGGNFVVDRTDDEDECHVVVSNTIGIAVFQDLTASRIKRLHQQIQAYLKAYTHVIIIACGSTDDAAWENLRDSYEGQGDEQ